MLALKQVDYSYTGNADELALQQVTLGTTPGSVTVVMGPNGAGKSTFLGVCLGWLKPLGGSVSLHGKSLASLSRKAVGRQVALVPQSEYIPFEYTAFDYALLGRSPYLGSFEVPGENDVTVALAAVEQVGIAHLADRNVHTLSAGELQLVLIARALTQQPDLLLMDEPGAHLDLANKRRLASLITRLAGSGVTVILTAHEPGFGWACGSQVVLMSGGAVVASGSPGETLTSDLLSATYKTDVQVHDVDGAGVAVWW